MADPEQVEKARRELGRKLAQLRSAADLNQHGLAAAVHYTRSTVANVEVGRQNAPREFWSRCDDVLAAGGVLRDGYEAVQQLRAKALRGAALRVRVPGVVPLSTPLASTRYIPFLPAALDGPALDWLVDDAPPDVNRLAGASDVIADEVADGEARLLVLRVRDHELGAGSVYPLVDAFIADHLRPLLTRSAADQSVRERLTAVAVGAHELAGYQAVDLGADGLAQRHYLRALTLSRGAGDRTYGAYLLGVSLGHLALHCGHPERTLRMVHTSIRGTVGLASPGVTAAQHAVLARAHARLGDEQACTSALRISEAALATSDPANEPEWITYLTQAYLADEVAHCLFDLDCHDSAQREVQQAVAGVGASRVRRLAIDTALLASSLARSGQLEEACARGRDAVELAARTTSVRTVQRVAQVRVDLAAYAGLPDVAQFSEYLAAHLPAAA